MNFSTYDMDMNMTDADPSFVSSSSSSAIPNEVATDLLCAARQLVDQGKSSEALQTMIMAMRAREGHGAVIQILQRAREHYINNLQATCEADKLASLFAQCAIAENQSVTPEPCPIQEQVPSNSVMMSNVCKTSILTESGRKQIMFDAVNDGSCFICLKCGGLVSVNRKDEHCSYWCQH